MCEQDEHNELNEHDEPKKHNEQWAGWAQWACWAQCHLNLFLCSGFTPKTPPKWTFFFQILEPCLLWGSPLFLKCPSRTGGATSAFPHSIIDNHDKKYIGGGRRRGRKDWDTYYYSLSDTHTSAPKMSQRMCSKNIRVVSHVWPGCVKT